MADDHASWSIGLINFTPTVFDELLKSTISLSLSDLKKLHLATRQNAHNNTIAIPYKVVVNYPSKEEYDGIVAKHAQNVNATWCEIFYLTGAYFPTGRTIYSFHVEDNDCAIVSAVNHYLRANRIYSLADDSASATASSKLSQKSLSLKWEWLSTYSDGNLNYQATGATNETEGLHRTTAGRVADFTSRPTPNQWMKGPDGSGKTTNSNIRGFVNQVKLRRPSTTIFISSSGNTSQDVLAALAILTKGGTAFIRIGDSPTIRDIIAITIMTQLFAKTTIIGCGRPYIVAIEYLEALGAHRINHLIEHFDAIVDKLVPHMGSILPQYQFDTIISTGFNPAAHIRVEDIDRRQLL